MKKLLCAVSLIFALLALCVAPLAEDVPAEDPVIATIGAQALKLSDVDYYAQQLATYGMIETVDDKQGAIDYALRYYLLPRAKVAEAGIENLLGEGYAAALAEAEAEYEDTISSYVSYFAADDADEAALAATREEAVAYFAEAGFDKESYINELLIGKAYDALMDAIEFEITDAQVEAEYDAAVKQYESYFADNVDMYEYYVNYYGYEVPYRPDGYRGVIHILLMAEDALSSAYAEAEGDEALAAAREAILDSLEEKINDIYARLEAGESFLDLLNEYNEDPGMTGENLENGYPVHANSIVYVPEFTAGSFSDKLVNVGDVSDPVVSQFGVHIIQYLRDIPGGAEPLSEEARLSLEEYLRDQAEAELVEQWLAEADVQYTDAYYALIGA